MPNYSALISNIQSVVRANGNNEITGPALQSLLISMVEALGVGYKLVGIANTNINPGSPDYNVAYLAGPGSYSHFGNKVVQSGNIGILKYNGTWSVEQFAISVPAASTDGIGGIRLGYNQNGKNYPVQVDVNKKAFVNVPWEGTGPGTSSDGGHWDQAFCGTETETPPSVPAANDPLDGTGTNGWNRNAPTNASGGLYIWMVVRWIEGTGTANEWQGPWRISGKDGDAGVDGDQFEYIYTRTATVNSQTPSLTNTTPASGSIGNNPTQDDFVPQGWTDNPQGIEDVDGHRVEWMAFRIRSGNRNSDGTITYTWSAFIGPVVWSVYGVSGMDGDGTEYIFCKGTTYPVDRPDGWPTNVADFQTREYIPTGSKGTTDGKWNDDPFDLTNELPGIKQWMSRRQKYADNPGEQPYWHAYSEPKLWNYAPKDGDAGIGVVADLDNETMAIGLDGNGNCFAYHQSTEATMYNGLSEVNATVHQIEVKTTTGTDLTSSYTNTSNYSDSTKKIYLVTSNNKNNIHVNFAAGAVNLGSYGIDVIITLRSSITISGSAQNVDRRVVLHIIGVNFGTDGASYSLNLGAPVIRVNRVGTRTPSAITPTCDWVIGLEPQTPFTPSSPQTGFSFKYSIDNGSESLLSTNSIDVSACTDSLRVVLLYNNALVDQETIFVVENGSDGENSIHLDLDNENDTILYNQEGTRVSGEVTSRARLYDGETDVTSQATFTISQRSGCSSSQATISGSGTSTVTVTVNGLDSSGYVMVRASYKGNYYYAKFTLKKSINGVKYYIVTSPSSVAYNTTTATFSDNTIDVTVRKGYQGSNGEYVEEDLTAFPISASATPEDGSYELYLEVDSERVNYSNGYSFSPNASLDKHTIKIIKKIAHVTYLVGDTTNPIINYTYETLDEETIPICKSANGSQGATGQNALPLRIRNWSQVYRGNVGDTALSGDNKIFSGWEEGAKFRDVILITEDDYSGGAIGYPFMENDKAMPTLVIINYSDNKSSGWDGTDIELPAVGSGSTNFSTDIATSKNISKQYSTNGIMWGVFMNFGALFISLLVATQGYVDDLTVKKLNTAGDSQSTSKRIVIENNKMYVFDAWNDQKILITADAISLISNLQSFPTYKNSIDDHHTGSGGGQSGTFSDELLIAYFNPQGSNKTVHIPALTISLDQQILYDGGYYNFTWDIYVENASGTRIATLGQGSSGNIGSITTNAQDLTLSSYQSGTGSNGSFLMGYYIRAEITAQWELDAESFNFPYGNDNISLHIAENTLSDIVIESGDGNSIQIGNNGMAIRLGGGFEALFGLNNATPVFEIKGRKSVDSNPIGLKIDSEGVKINRGDGQGYVTF